MLQVSISDASLTRMTPTFDDEAFFAALDAKRLDAGWSWRPLGRERWLSAPTFSRLARGRRPDVETFLRLAAWIGSTPTTFLVSAEAPTRESTLTTISAALRRDRTLGKEDAVALDEIVRTAYRRLSR